jgi:hypothetical protein
MEGWLQLLDWTAVGTRALTIEQDCEGHRLGELSGVDLAAVERIDLDGEVTDIPPDASIDGGAAHIEGVSVSETPTLLRVELRGRGAGVANVAGGTRQSCTSCAAPVDASVLC